MRRAPAEQQLHPPAPPRRGAGPPGALEILALHRVAGNRAVGRLLRQVDPRHARGYAGEQGMGFGLYRAEDGWIFFEGPSGAAGHGVTRSGFDGVAYNTRTGELHLIDNKSLKRPGNVASATAIDPAANLGQNVDALITRVEAARDVPGRVRILGLLRQLKAAVAAKKPPPPGVKLIVTSEGGQTTDVSARLQGLGVEHNPPPPKNAPAPPAATPAPAEKVVPPPEAVPVPEVVPPVEPPVAVAPPVARPSPLKAGLKAGGWAAAQMLLFAALDYYVHEQLQEQLEDDIATCRPHMLEYAEYLHRKDASHPYYYRVVVRSEEYSQYIPFLGWMPVAPRLLMTSCGVAGQPIDPPVVEVDDHSLDLLRPGKTVEVTYTEPLIP